MTTAIRDAERSFAELVEPYRSELHAHCYRMLGSVHDADDALQEALLGAWRGGRVRGAQLDPHLALHDRHQRLAARPGGAQAARAAGRQRQRGRSARAARRGRWPSRCGSSPIRTSSGRGRGSARRVELAYVAALQLLPPNQRAALILREVLGFSAREVAEILETSVVSVNSAVQRARAKLERELPARSQQQTLRALGDARSRELVARFVDAWNRADVAGDRRDADRGRALHDAAAADLVPGPERHRGLPHRTRLPQDLAVRGDERRRTARDGRPPAGSRHRALRAGRALGVRVRR